MKTPLWMPVGSVRDLVFLEVMTTVCYMALCGSVKPESFLVIVSSVVSFLIGAKSAQPPANGGTP